MGEIIVLALVSIAAYVVGYFHGKSNKEDPADLAE